MPNPSKKAFLVSFFADEILPLLKEFGVPLVRDPHADKPQTIIAYGGDGTFLNAERDFPGVPKLILRRPMGHHVDFGHLKRLLKDFVEKEFPILEFPKISFHYGATEGVATADVILRNVHPNQALRFSLDGSRGGKCPKGEVVGDGLVLATPVGASAYYYSITRKGFSSNFGLAFNNPITDLPAVSLEDDFCMKVTVLREQGILCYDNLPCFWSLRPGEFFTVGKKKNAITRLWDVRKYYQEEGRKHLNF